MFRETSYLSWANRWFGQAEYNLAKAGMRSVSLATLGMPPSLDDPHALEALRERLALHLGVEPAAILPALGTTHALWLALSALLEPGDDVLVETPAYEALVRIPEGLGARVRRFERPFARGCALDVDSVLAGLGPRTRVVIMTSPHNPSGRRTSHAELARLSDLCAQRGATLLVDEIFADYGSASPADAMGGRAQRASPAIVSVSGLSKAYGLGSLRVGWLVAAPPLVERATHVLQACLADLPVAQLCLAAHAFSHLPALAAEREREAADQRRLVSEWIAARPHLSWHEPDHVPYGLVRVRGGYDLTSALERGVRSHGVLAVPGAFFGMEDTFRLGFAMEPARLACALGLLDRVLDDFARCRSPITPSAA